MNSPKGRPGFGVVAIRGTAWRYMSYFGGKLLVFISTIILARLLTKDDFGLVSYALITIAFLDVASDLGVAEAVVYHKEDRVIYSTAFWISIGIGIALFGLSWVLAPLLAVYFHDERVVEINRMMALTFPFTALGSTHEAVLRKNLSFDRTAIPVILRAVTKGVVSVTLAFMGFQVWSLVWGQVSGPLVASIVLWVITPWKPTFNFDVGRALSLLRYGMKNIGSDFLSMILLNLDYWLVGRYLGAAELGVYSLSYRMPELLILQFARIASQVVFPIYTKMRSIPDSLANGFRKATTYVSLVTVPLALGLALLAEPFTLVFLTEKWIDAVPVIRAIALYSLFLSLMHNTSSVYKAQGNFRTMTSISLVRLAILFPALWWATTVANSIVAVGWMHAVVAFLSLIISLTVACRMLGLSLFRLVASLWPPVLAGAIMTVFVVAVLQLSADLPSVVQLLLAVPVGAAAYGVTLWLVSREMALDVIRKLQAAISRRKAEAA